MRVVSIKEPYASLIKDGIKTVETRTWKTNYRGEIYIHSCVAKEPIKDSIKYLVSSELKYGYIICKCKNYKEKFNNNDCKKSYNNRLPAYGFRFSHYFSFSYVT